MPSVSVLLVVSQPVSITRWPFAPMPRLVPPTAVTHGSLAGKSASGCPTLAASSPLSPEEKLMLMPSSAPSTTI